MCPNLGAANAAPWGDPQWIGLGFLVFTTILLVEYFGSPFLKNCQVVVGLIVGIVVSAATGYLDVASINAAPSATFLWVKTFPLSGTDCHHIAGAIIIHLKRKKSQIIYFYFTWISIWTGRYPFIDRVSRIHD